VYGKMPAAVAERRLAVGVPHRRFVAHKSEKRRCIGKKRGTQYQAVGLVAHRPRQGA